MRVSGKCRLTVATALLIALSLIGRHEMRAAGPVGLDVAYVSDFEVHAFSEVTAPSIGLIINTGTQSLDLTRISVLSVTDDHPQAVVEFFLDNAVSTLDPGQAGGDLTADPQALLAGSGLVPEPVVAGDPTLTLHLFNLPPLDTVIHATVVLGVDNQVVTLPFTIRRLAAPPASVNLLAVNRARGARLNNPPVAFPATVATNEDTPASIPLSAQDPDGDPLTYRVVTGPAHGTAVLSGATATYTPAANYHGPDSFTFRANDGAADSNIATVSLIVTPVNDAPVAADQTVATDEDTAKAITLSATDVDGDALTYTVVTPPAHGTLTDTPPTLTYVPTPGYHGPDSFQFQATDLAGAGSNLATVSITVNAVNHAPTANPLTVSTDEDTPVPVTLTGSDPDGDPLTFTLVRLPTSGALTGAAPNLTYTPDANTSGDDSFTFRVSDGALTSSDATVTLHVRPVNDPPVAAGQSLSTDEDTSVSITLLATDVEGDALTYRLVTGPSHGTLTGSPPNLIYTPAADYNGPDSFTFTANDGQVDGNTATVSITVKPVNDAPVAADQPVVTDEDSPKAISLSATDVDGDALTYTVVTPPAHGILTGTAPALTYTPGAGYHGPDSFQFKATDPVGADSNLATVSITVNAVNHAPTANPQVVTTDEDTPMAITLTGSDPDGDPLTFTVTSLPAKGTLSGTAPNLTYTPGANLSGDDSFTFRVSDGALTSSDATVALQVRPVNDPPIAAGQTVTTDEDTPVSIALQATDVEGDALTYRVVASPSHGTLTGTAPNLIYTPAANYNGPDSFTFTANDGQTDGNIATVSITVNPVNDAPVALDQSVATLEGTAKPITLSATDVDGDLLTYTVITLPANGTLTGTAPSLTYVPATGYHGPDSFQFKATDSAGADSNLATVSITVNAVNHAPTANPQAVTTDEDTPAAITLTGSDPDGDPITFSVTALPAKGTLSGTAPNLIYTPGANVSGDDSFTFRVSDGSLASADATVTLHINPVNDAPVAAGQTVTTDEDTPASISLTATDTDGDLLTYRIVTGPTHGTLTGTAPNLTYTLARDFNGPDSFTFQANDGQADSNLATVSLNVNPVNDAPIANAGLDQIVDATGLTTSVTLDGSASTDVDGDPLAYAWAEAGSPLGTGARLTVPFSPGAHTLTLTVTDPTGASGTDDVVVTVRDGTPPTTAASLVGTAGTNGWFRSAVTVTLSASDTGSGVAGTTYSVDGGPTTAYGSPVVVSGDGAHALQFSSTDQAGNHESLQSVSFRIDTTLPGISFGTPTPAPNALGWNNTDVSIPFTSSDATSGIAATTPVASPLVLSLEGLAVRGTVTATDGAGNTRSLASPVVRIDKTGPTVRSTLSPRPNAAGWNNSPVTVSFSASDALSGMVLPSTQDVVVSVEGAGKISSASFSDRAGNRTVGTATVNLDRTPPTMICPPSQTAPRDPGRNTATGVKPDGTPRFGTATATDTLSGIALVRGTRSDNRALTAPYPLGRTTITWTAVDRAGNQASCTQTITIN
jgi:hypothetical protein